MFDSKTYLILFLVFLTGIVLAGCANYSTDNPHDDYVFISKSAEKEMGQSAANRLEEKVGLYRNDTYVEYVDNVGSRLVVYSDRPELDYKFGILDWFEVNALALPGGYIYITRGLLREVENEAQLAGILAHEIAHVAAYHAVKRRQWSVGTLLAAAAIAAQTGGRGARTSLAARQFFQLGYTRSAEREADRLGIQYSARAGYHPAGLREFLKRLQELSGEIPNERTLYMRTHPFLRERIQNVRPLIEDQLENFESQPIVRQGRYQRYRSRYLYSSTEEDVLDQFHAFIDAYEQKNIQAMKSKVGDDFKVGSGDSEDTGAKFFREIESRFQRTDRIEYQHRIMNLDVGDTNATIFYQYEEKRWPKDGYVPEINEGFQELVWRNRSSWKLIRLR